ncbi:MAG TPA: HepT-like ribonuclease domain-containing protein [Solirubrobacteraceae bacterium]|nr:HepT-like ribonuclease domain-containing protein [Solirubrobacteraceae bacterium]
MELAELRGRRDETNARRDLDALREAGVISGELARRLQRLRELRRMLVHEYATATAEQVHESALIMAGSFPAFYDAYRAWIKRRFALQP